MSENMKTSQTTKSSKSEASTVVKEQTPQMNSANTEGKNKIQAMQELYNSIKSALHGKNEQIKLCEWQLPPNASKESCTPKNCEPRIG